MSDAEVGSDADNSPFGPSIEDSDDDLDDEGLSLPEGPIQIDQPEYNSRLGAIGNAWRQYRHNKKRKKVASKGYIQWYLIDDSWPKPKYVKPERKGGGIREYEHDGEIYLFPREAFLSDRRTGTWTVVHRKGELDPVALQEPGKNALDADAAKKWAELTVTSDPPGWLDSLDVDSKDLMTYLIFGIIALAVGQQMLGGGIV